MNGAPVDVVDVGTKVVVVAKVDTDGGGALLHSRSVVSVCGALSNSPSWQMRDSLHSRS